MHMHAHIRMHMPRAYVMALQAWVAAKRTRDFDEADRIREAMLAAGMRRLSKGLGLGLGSGPACGVCRKKARPNPNPNLRPNQLMARGWP